MCMNNITKNRLIQVGKNKKLGKKVFITGKGRCNVTNACDTEELFPAMMSNRKQSRNKHHGNNHSIAIVDPFTQMHVFQTDISGIKHLIQETLERKQSISKKKENGH